MKRLCKQRATAFLAFAVKDVPQRCQVVIAAEVNLKQVTFNVGEAIGQPKPGGSVAGDGNHLRPVDGGDADVVRFLGKRYTPNSRSCRKVRDAIGRPAPSILRCWASVCAAG